MAQDAQEKKQASLGVLIVDDDDSLRQSLQLNLEEAGYMVREASSANSALSILGSESFEIILCDLRMPGIDGMSFIKKCNELNPETAVVLMTGFGSTELAVEALRAGAYDYISKPFTGEELLLALRKIEEREHLRHENEDLKKTVGKRFQFSNIIAKSEKMQSVFETVKRLSAFHTTVLLSGESGTGKELLARAIHHNSPRKGSPFVAINCGAIPEHLIESELFGHKKGAFTDATRDKNGLFSEADGGTIFLDEVGEMPLHLQVKLLRVLQEKMVRPVGGEVPIEINVRVLAATLRNLSEDVKNGRFREDLFYRLNVVNIHLPPLRERTEDIPLLVEFFLKKHSKRLGVIKKPLSATALRCLLAANWKGNIRELENAIERALVLSESEEIVPEDFPSHIAALSGSAPAVEEYPAITGDDLSIKKRTRALEIELIRRALKKTDGNRTHAAKTLEISHRALLYKMKEYDIS